MSQKLLLRHTVDEVDPSTTWPIVTDFAGNYRDTVYPVTDDDVLVAASFYEADADPATVVVMTGATAVECIIRAGVTDTSAMLSYQDSYNQEGDSSIENLATGNVTFRMGIGPILYAITSATSSTKTFTISGDYAVQFVADNGLTVQGSTGNDGAYTVVSAAYSTSTGLTSVVVSETVADETADGDINHSALQNLTFNATYGYVTAYLEITWTDANGYEQTILPMWPIRIKNQLNNNPIGVTPGRAPTYYTKTQADARFALQATQVIAGDGLQGGGTLAANRTFNIDVSDFAGTGLEDDGSENLRIAAAAAGNGLTGGAGSALSVVADATTGGNVLPVSVTSNGVGFDQSTITTVPTHASTHADGGADELDLADLGSGSATDGYVATADGTGGVVWEAAATGTGDVVGPASATDNAFAQFDGTTGKLLKDGVVSGAASGNVVVRSGSNAIAADTISEITSAAGVTIDGMLIKDNVITMDEHAAPSTPATGKVALYPKSDGLLYSKDDAGVETLVSGGLAGGATALTAAAVITDNAVIRGDGGSRGTQESGVIIDDSDNVSGMNSLAVTTYIEATEGSAPSTPATNKWRVYFKTDGMYVIDDAGTETGPFGTGGGGGGALTDWFIPASKMTVRVTNGGSVAAEEFTTNKVNEEYISFPRSAEKWADFTFMIPTGWDAGTVTATVYWDGAAGASAADTVEWEIGGRAYSDDEALDQAVGTTQVISDALHAVGDEHITSPTPAITIAGTPAAGKRNRFTISRNVSGTDDMTEDAKLRGVRLVWTNS